LKSLAIKLSKSGDSINLIQSPLLEIQSRGFESVLLGVFKVERVYTRVKFMRKSMNRWLFISFFALTGCFQAYNEDDDLRAVPVTNNPHIVPHYGTGLPMGGGDQSR
jgi:hypothetical protein